MQSTSELGDPAKLDHDQSRHAEPVERRGIVVRKRNAIEMPKQRRHGNPSFESRERRPQAAVDSESECEVGVGIAVDRELVGPREDLFVAVCRRDQGQDQVTLGDALATEFDVPSRAANRQPERRVIAEGLLDETRDQLR